MGMNRRFIVSKLEEYRNLRTEKLLKEIQRDKIMSIPQRKRELHVRMFKGRIKELNYSIRKLKRIFQDTHEFKENPRFES